MAYYTIHYTADGRPYIIQKNFGHRTEKEESSSHWTWHNTSRGVKHLSKTNPLRPGSMPTYINEDEFEDPKAYKMLARASGKLIGTKGLYPSDDPTWEKETVQRERTSQEIPAVSIKKRTQPETRPSQSTQPPQRSNTTDKTKVEEKPKGLLGSLRSLFGKP